MDRGSLERELASAVDREQHRRDVDEMKKRAIHTARSYDEFKNLVACAGMKPLSRQDIGSKAVVPANRMASRLGEPQADPFFGTLGLGSLGLGAGVAGDVHTVDAAAGSTRGGGGGGGGVAASGVLPPAPRTAAEFDAAWRRLGAGAAVHDKLRCVHSATRGQRCYRILVGCMRRAVWKPCSRAATVPPDSTRHDAVQPPHAHALSVSVQIPWLGRPHDPAGHV
jgi:hypothetical protein